MLFCSVFSEAQNTTQDDYKLPNVVQPSHNAISLGRFGDVPVSYYNGMPQISIPLMPLETATGFKLPLSLDYHPSGVKLNDMPSMVGMNWALSAGGVITRTIRGGEDFGAFGANFPDAFHDGFYFTNERSTADQVCLFRAKASTGVYDIEPDNFFYNIPGGSGRFNFTEQRAIEQFPEKNMFIEVTNSPSKGQTPEWRITDAANNQYLFLDNEVEFTEVTNSNAVIYGVSNGIPSGSISSTPEAATSFWLSNIKPANGNVSEVINFTYLSYDAEYITQNSGSHSIGVFGKCLDDMIGSMNASANTSRIRGRFKHLQHITYKNYDIEFIYVDPGIPSGIKALKEIKYRHNGTLYRHIVLDYLVEANKDRFWLTKVTDVDVTNGATTNNYELSYNNQDLLPARLSGHIDAFGYFNNNQHPLRAPRVPVLPNGNPLHPTYENVNPIVDMTPDAVKTTYGMLAKITYPTKGYSEFTFEAHEYSNFSSGVGGGVRIQEIKNFEKQGPTAFNIKQFEYIGGKLMAEPHPYYLASSISHPGDYCIRLVSSTTGNVPLSNSAMGSTVGYDKVIVRNKSNANINADNGRTEYTYKNETDLPPTIYTEVWATLNYLSTYRFPPGTPFANTQSWSNGFLLKEAHYHANGNISMETDYVMDGSTSPVSKAYTFYTGPASSYGGVFNVNDICVYISTIQYTRVHPGVARPGSKTTKTYNLINGMPTADFITTTETYTYDKLLPYETITTNSKNQTIRKQLVYQGAAYPYFTPNVLLIERTYKDLLDIELKQYTYLNTNRSLPDEISHMELTGLGSSAGNSTMLTNDTKVTYQYNSDNQLVGATPFKSSPMAYLWDNDLGKVIAIAGNTTINNMAYTSFENALAKGRFVFDQSGMVADARTGFKGFNLSNTNTLTTSLNDAGKYRVSFWVKTNFANPNVLVTNGSVLSNFEETYAGFGWKLLVYTIELYGVSTVEIRGTGIIDEVQVIATNATIKTYTHHPFFGPLSETDEKNTLKTFGYDAFGRLNVIKDHKGAVLNIVKYNLR